MPFGSVSAAKLVIGVKGPRETKIANNTMHNRGKRNS